MDHVYGGQPEMTPKRIWITGVCSLIGSHLAKALMERGDTVGGNDSGICDTRHNMPKGLKRFTSISCQEEPQALCRKSLAEELREFKPDVVVHCAATAAEGFSVFSPHFITSNIAEASVATFSAAIAAKAKRIVNFSSMSRYGKGKPPFKEDDPVAPVDCYALAKVYAEGQLKILCEAHGVAWTIAVPHNVIGPGQEITPYRNVATIFLNALKQR
jgi:UDP-glucose 4-epimerase